MMQQLLSNWPLVVIAQFLGVALAWGADVVSWKWRRDEKLVFALNLLGLVLLVPVVGLLVLFSFYGRANSFFLLLIEPVRNLVLIGIWLLFVSWMQKRQWRITFRAAFFGVLMQCLSVIFVLCGGFLGWSVWLWVSDGFAMTGLVSTLATYFMLSLFRPTIYGAWQTWRQNSGKT